MWGTFSKDVGFVVKDVVVGWVRRVVTHTSADFFCWNRFLIFLRVESDFRLYVNRHIVLSMTSPRRGTDADAYTAL